MNLNNFPLTLHIVLNLNVYFLVEVTTHRIFLRNNYLKKIDDKKYEYLQ